MGKDTKISWAEHTFNPWIGCTKVSPGCDACYAEAYDKRVGGDHWGTGKPRRRTTPANWNKVREWNRAAEAEGQQARVFCLSLGDVLDPEAPAGAREDLWDLVDETPWLLWLLLTKRPQLYPRYLPLGGFAHDNVMPGCTTESQPYFDERAPAVIAAAHVLTGRNGRHRPRVKSFISYEPALGPIVMGQGPKPDWLIFGGETGPWPRPMELGWAESIQHECAASGVAFWMKQMSARTPAAAEALIPAGMLIRQFPGGTTR